MLQHEVLTPMNYLFKYVSFSAYTYTQKPLLVPMPPSCAYVTTYVYAYANASAYAHASAFSHACAHAPCPCICPCVMTNACVHADAHTLRLTVFP